MLASLLQLVSNLGSDEALGLAIAFAAGGSSDRVMDRRTFLETLAGGLLAAPLTAETFSDSCQAICF